MNHLDSEEERHGTKSPSASSQRSMLPSPFFPNPNSVHEEPPLELSLPVSPAVSEPSFSLLDQIPMLHQQYLFLARLLQCKRLITLMALTFFGLTVSSVVEYSIILHGNGSNNFFVLACIFQNLLHTYLFSVELAHVVQKRIDDLQNNEQSSLNQFLESYADIGFLSVLFFVASKRITLFKFNQTVFSVMFVVGFTRLFDKSVQLWFMCTELALGFLLFGVMISMMVAICLAMPVMFCCMYFNERHPNTIELTEPIEHIELPDPVPYSTLPTNHSQPCYICLQEYENEELVVELPCLAKHVFHHTCIEPWVEHHAHCPVCRQVLH